jgi:hypothetical protein
VVTVEDPGTIDVVAPDPTTDSGSDDDTTDDVIEEVEIGTGILIDLIGELIASDPGTPVNPDVVTAEDTTITTEPIDSTTTDLDVPDDTNVLDPVTEITLDDPTTEEVETAGTGMGLLVDLLVENALNTFTEDIADNDEIYTNPEYNQAILGLVVQDQQNCGGDKAMDCLEKVYGGGTSSALTEKEIGDAVVFNKKPGEIVIAPRIVNLKGTVGNNPVILVMSTPNDQLFVRINTVPMMTVKGFSDSEGKAVLGLLQPLKSGAYSAETYAVRNGVAVNGNKVLFTVDAQVDKDFYISDLTVTEENAHETYDGEVGEFVTFLLNYIEKFEPTFIVKDYIEFSKTGGKIYYVQGRSDQLKQKENTVVYLVYKSVTFGSAVISDASQKGSFRMVVPRGLGINAHTLTAYAFNPKNNVSTSAKKVTFVIKK